MAVGSLLVMAWSGRPKMRGSVTGDPGQAKRWSTKAVEINDRLSQAIPGAQSVQPHRQRAGAAIPFDFHVSLQ